ALNKAACSLLEYSELELVGRPIEELFKNEPYVLAAPVPEMLRTNTMRDHEMTYRTRSGRLISALVSASTMRDNSGRPLAIITVVILELWKIEAVNMSVEAITGSPVQIVGEISALMAVRAANKNLSFDVRYSGPIHATIRTDPTRLRQILVNLLGNAIKFTEK